ncbi:MAG TPA: hypothetical protein VHB21_24435, partial [Minicystis sp.]|nr:hypothetical protein [Minicystis sp.]
CGPAGQRDVERAKTFAWIADGGFGVAAVGLVAGGVLLLTTRPRGRPAAALAVAPAPGGAVASLHAGF